MNKIILLSLILLLLAGTGALVYAGFTAIDWDVVGGGVSLGFGNATFRHNTISGNRSIGGGGGIEVRISPLSLQGDIISNNASVGSGGNGVLNTDEYYQQAATLTMTNTIVFSHTVGIQVASGSTARLNATLWQANGTDWGSAGTINHSNDHTGDPKFAFDGYHLLPGSAAIDRGVNAGVTTDIDGDARPYGSGYDIGADAYTGIAINARKLYLPLSLYKR